MAGICVCLTVGFSARAQTFPTNLQITITEPADGQVFTNPVNVQIDAQTPRDVLAVTLIATPGGSAVLPQFGIYLGTVFNGVATGTAQKLFEFTWTNAPPGTWVITAQGNGAALYVSQRVTITVQNGSPRASVVLGSPTNGETFAAPASIQLIAGVRLANGASPDTVEFFDNSRSIGVSSNFAVVDPPGFGGVTPGSLACLLEWTNVPAGVHVLAAEALNPSNPPVYSAPVTIYVNSNSPPAVRIASPPDNSFFRGPVNIPLLAYAHDPSGYVATVQFFAGSNSLGFGAPLGGAEPLPTPIFQTNMFELIWSNAPAGSNAITAVAVNNAGLSGASTPVNIIIALPPPPPSNELNVVSIVAADPIAISGTNCWRRLGLADTNGPPAWSNWVSPAALFRWFTNCGPDDAVFAVHRRGATNNSLTVSYSVGGTASNGVDYAQIPGAATIPAGQMEADITIVPMDGQTNAAIETVIIDLTPSANTPPSYALGLARAEAIIVDSEPPRPALAGAILGDHSFHLSMAGPDGAWFRVDDTGDGLNWTPVCTNQVVNGSIDFTDPGAPGASARFYRVVPLSQPPAN
jgi:hypothetical protein